jgi:hypothetical protein
MRCSYDFSFWQWQRSRVFPQQSFSANRQRIVAQVFIQLQRQRIVEDANDDASEKRID